MTGSSFATAAWVAAFARSSAFAASVPLGSSGAVPNAVRAVLALALTPAIVPHVSMADGGRLPEAAFAGDAIVGAAFGLSAALIAAAAASAGSLIDATLASAAVMGREAVFGTDGGPVARLYSLAFAAAFFGSGAMTYLCERFVTASSDNAIAPTLRGSIELVRACCDASIGLAVPAIIAQLLGTIVAAASARAAPRVNGLMLSSPLVTALALTALFAAAPATFAHLIALARAAATTPPL